MSLMISIGYMERATGLEPAALGWALITAKV
jgi:hypothetical protein